MADEKTHSPPYVGFGSFQTFISGLRGAPLPDRIDRSVFGSMSGGLAYGLLSALKFLNLIDANGVPTPLLAQMAEAEGDGQKAALRVMLEGAYPGLFDGTVKLDRATSAQLDDHLRKTFAIAGSTVDKAASFVLAAAAAADITISNQLKARKPIASGGATQKKLRLKRNGAIKETAPIPENDQRDRERPPPPTSKDPVQMLVEIIDMSAMDDEEQQAVWTLIRFLKRQEAKKRAMEEDQ